MCGLVGLAGEITFKEEKVFKDLLLLDAIRGKHSTGVASLHKVGNEWTVGIVKDKLNSIDFMDLPEFGTLMGKQHKILMGHNRHATRGAIVKENAHPFEFSKVVGAHNGSLTSVYNLHEHSKYPVDSQAAYSEMNENGVASLWGKLNGAAALTWINKEDQTLHFLRNDERPLWFTTLNKGRTLIWASEYWMIHVACGRQGVDIDAAPREVQIDQHYSFHVPLTADKKDVVTYQTEKLEAYVASKWTQNWGKYYNDYDSGYGEGKKFLEKEGVREYDEVEFTVDQIKDTMDNGKARSTVIGKTLKGTPVHIYAIDSKMYEDLLLDMWEGGDLVFKAKISYASASGFYLAVYSARAAGYSLADLAAALGDDPDDFEKLPEGVKYHTLSYKIGCSYCRDMVKAYYTSPTAKVCCERCWDEEVSRLSAEERAKLEPGYRYNKRLN